MTSKLRPDAVDTLSGIIYELKPCNEGSFMKATNQVKNYLNVIPCDTSDWTVVIDMYFIWKE